MDAAGRGAAGLCGAGGSFAEGVAGRRVSDGSSPERSARSVQAFSPLSRVLHWLQNLGHFIPASTFPASFAVFHSAAPFFWRSRAAIWPADGSLPDFLSAFLRARRAGRASSDGAWACATAEAPDGAVCPKAGVIKRVMKTAAAPPIKRVVMPCPSLSRSCAAAVVAAFHLAPNRRARNQERLGSS